MLGEEETLFLKEDEGQLGSWLYASIAIADSKMRGIRYFSREVLYKWLFPASIWKKKIKKSLLDCKLWFGIWKTGGLGFF